MIWECVSDMRSAFTESNNKKPLETARERRRERGKKKGEGRKGRKEGSFGRSSKSENVQVIAQSVTVWTNMALLLEI